MNLKQRWHADRGLVATLLPPPMKHCLVRVARRWGAVSPQSPEAPRAARSVLTLLAALPGGR